MLTENPIKENWTIDDINEILEEGVSDKLLFVPITISLNTPDWKWSEEVCIRLSSHENEYVRGNSILGFGYLAMRRCELNRETVQPIIEAGLKDSSEHVRNHSEDATIEVNDHLSWNIIND